MQFSRCFCCPWQASPRSTSSVRQRLSTSRGRGASFGSAGITTIPGEGTVYSSYRTRADWGTLEASAVLVDMDRGKLTVPAPAVVEGKTLKGDGWTLAIADDWVIRPGPRAGDFQLVRER